MTHSLSLYQLSDTYLHALDFLCDAEQEIPAQAIQDTLEALEGELKDKAINVAQFIRNLESTTEAIKQAEQNMAKRRKAYEQRIVWLRQYLKTNLEVTGINKLECPYFRLTIVKNPAALEIFDDTAIPEQFRRIETVITEHFDKTAIKAALSAGQTVDGTRLVSGSRLVIR